MNVLLDTGPWAALLDRSESRHVECVDWFKRFTGRIFSTEAVLTEVLYLVNFSYPAQAAAIDFVLTGAVTLVPSSVESLTFAKSLMDKYQDLPLDFADATLVALAHDLNVNHVVSFDRKHFSIYRLFKRRAFVVLP